MNKTVQKTGILILLIIGIYFPTFPNSVLDSLYLELAVVKTDTGKVDILNKITREYRIDDPKKAFEFNVRAFDLAKEINYSPGIARAYDLLGTIYRYQGNYTNALDNYFKAEGLYKQLNDSARIANLYNYIGGLYRKSGNFDKGLSYRIKAHDIFKAIGDYKGLAIIYNNLGNIYSSLDEDSLALYYYKQAFEMNRKINRKLGMGWAFLNIANIYMEDNQHLKAKNYYFQSLDYFLEVKNIEGLAISYFNIGNVYIHLEQADSARFYLLKSNDLTNQYSMLKRKQLNILGLKRVCKLQGNYIDAVTYLEEYIEIQDSLLDRNINSKILDLEKKVEFEKALKDQELELLEKSRKIKINTLQKYILLIILFSMFVISWILINRKGIRIKYFNEKLRLKDSEAMSYAMYVLQKNDLIHEFRSQLLKLQKRLKVEDNKQAVNEIINSLIFKIALSKDIEKFRDKLREISEEFYRKLERKFPDLTPKEKQLVTLIRMNLTTKQIGVILDCTTESIEKSRSRLRKKLGLSQDNNLKNIINQI